MCTIENPKDLCKGLLEASSIVMVPLEQSCGRGAQVSAAGAVHATGRCAGWRDLRLRPVSQRVYEGGTRSTTVSQWRFSVWKNGSGTLALIVDARSQ